uniref:Ig-like domain-containing protein n=1 Tax=Callorhinchus milii TaxID=7868 RepID=A0A4W3GU91_CALMI
IEWPDCVALRVFVWGEWRGLQDIVNQTIAEIPVEEGKDVKLSCTLKKISDANYLYWDRQASRNSPVSVLYSIAGKDYMSPDFPDRFSSNVDKTSEYFKLSIPNVLIRDSAVYYCIKPVKHLETHEKVLFILL